MSAHLCPSNRQPKPRNSDPHIYGSPLNQGDPINAGKSVRRVPFFFGTTSHPCLAYKMEAKMRKEIRTERLVLRPIALKDVSNLSQLGGVAEIARMTSTLTHPFPELSAEFWVMQKIAQKRQGLSFTYAITKDGGALMGVVDIFRRAPDAALELGYWLGIPFWGQGYMLEACRAVIREAKEGLGATRLSAGVYTDNPKSLRLLQKLGFKAEQGYAQWFSMARMEKARGIDLTLDLSSLSLSNNKAVLPLPLQPKLVMRA